MITIHNFARGPRGLRVLWQCEEMGLPYRALRVAFPPDDAYRRLNPLASVPFLQDEGAVAINESVAMMLYLAERYGPTPLLPGRNDPALARVLQMTVFGETAIGMNLNPLFEARFMAAEPDQRNWSVLAQERRVQQAVQYVQTMLGAQDFLAGGAFTLADISVACALVMCRAGLGQPLPEALDAYCDRMTARPAHQRALVALAGPEPQA